MNTSTSRMRFAVDMVGIAFSAISIFFLSLYISGRALSFLVPATTGVGLTAHDFFDGSSFAFVQNSYSPERAGTGLPVRLKIPKINVDSAVEYVGLDANGAMDVPKDRANVAWFNIGSRPGESGSAVVAGHYGFREGKGSAFDDLHKLHKGDTVSIEDDNGLTTTFVVRESRRFEPDADSTEVFNSFDGTAHLNLITCEGEWDDSTNQYPSRLIVFTDKQ